MADKPVLPKWYHPDDAHYDEPLPLEHGLEDYVQALNDIDEQGMDSTSARREMVGSDETSEPMEGFLNRYVPDWNTLNEQELLDELTYLIKQFNFSVFDKRLGVDYTTRKLYLDDVADKIYQGFTNELIVRYYHPTTAAFEDDDIVIGQDYLVVKSPDHQYLTVGEVFTADSMSRRAIGLHKDKGRGPGTFVDKIWLRRGDVVLEPVDVNYEDDFTESTPAIHITGTKVQSFRLQTSLDRVAQVDYWLPAQTDANIALLVATAEAWELQAIDLATESNRLLERSDQSRRAQFASDTAFVAATIVAGQGYTGGVLVGVNQTANEIVGISVYHVFPDHSANVSLVSTSPNNQPDSQSQEKIRGVGTAMVCLMAKEFKLKSVTRICLKPLDSDAEKFWRNRGFNTYEGQLCIINNGEKLMEACLLPECPDNNEHCQIGLFGTVKAYAKPGRRGIYG